MTSILVKCLEEKSKLGLTLIIVAQQQVDEMEAETEHESFASLRLVLHL